MTFNNNNKIKLNLTKFTSKTTTSFLSLNIFDTNL